MKGRGSLAAACASALLLLAGCAAPAGPPFSALATDARFASNSLRVANRTALDGLLAGALSARTAAEVDARLDAAGIANARLGSIGQFVDHPQLTARERWREIDSPAGPLRALLPPIEMADVAPVMGAVPSPGQHTDAILAELGFDAGVVEAWRREGTI